MNVEHLLTVKWCLRECVFDMKMRVYTVVHSSKYMCTFRKEIRIVLGLFSC